ncbi:MAG: ABC transporter ATP-binding protein [Chloroflexi bacterium]|nr:ABC transporter ATP-binding protein [Chloroflexota bacterium]
MGIAARLRENIIRTFNLRQAVRMVYSASPRLFAAGVVLVIIQSALPVVVLYLTKLMIDDITAQLGLPADSRDFSRILLLIALVGLVTLLEVVFSTLNALVAEAQGDVVADSILTRIQLKSVEVDLAYYENAQIYDKLHRAQADAPFRPPRIVNGLLRMGQSSLSLIGMIGLLATVNLWIAVLVLVAALPRLLVRLWSSRTLNAWLKRRSATERLLVYYNYLLTLSYYAKEIRLFDLGKLFASRYAQTRRTLRQERLAISTRRSAFDIGAQAVAVTALFAAYALVANDALIGGVTIGSLVISFQAFQRVQGYFGDVLSQLGLLYEDNLFLQNYYSFMAIQPQISAPANPLPPPAEIRSGIRFEDVSFSYSSRAKPVLEGIDLEIKAGEVVALVGENGAGKTTLAKLLCRLYDPSGGRITVDGVDIRSFDPAALRRTISAIFQDFVAYNMTVGENIWVADTTTPLDLPRVDVAAHKAEAHPVVESLPNGYDTLLGDYFEGGQSLSVGQWQKVALARAFYRDSQVIILDEPTAALDVLTEAAVFEHFKQIAQGKTALLISHRLSTVRMADRIFVLDDGKIAESGTHIELMALDGIYAHLFRTQAHNYTLGEDQAPPAP